MGLGARVNSIEQNDARYRLLVQSVTDYAIYMLDASGIVSSWNAGAERFKGYTSEEIIGRHFSCFYTESDRATGLPARALETAAREGKFENEGWRVRRDGSRFWAHVVIHPIRDSNGNLAGFAKVTRDLTERKRADEALRRSEEQFRLLVRGVTDYAIYMLSPEGIITNWNIGAERIKGYLPSEIIGKHFSHFYTEEDRAAGEPQRALETAIREGRFEKEGWRVRKDGTQFWSHVVIDPIHDDAGVLVGFAKITRDVTERKNNQTALERAREALFQSQKMDAIGQLTGGMAHDFNNLLTAILGCLELLRKRLPDDPTMRRLLDNAVLGAQRGASLTQRMLAFARRQDLNPQPVDVVALVRNMTELLERTLGASMQVDIQFPLFLSKVRADENQLELALLNLAVNARDAMPEGGALLISAREHQVGPQHETGLAPGSYVCLCVIDQGEGMNKETLARATEPFFTTKGVGKGTGLGLSMVHGMAEQMGGRLILKSREGQGTTAEIWLPTALPDAVPERKNQMKEELEVRALRILAVDDDALVLFNTAAMLEDLGHTVLQANSGNAALELLKHYPVDIVLTDHLMPKMTGLQLLEAIKAQWPEVQGILATGFAEIPGEAEAKTKVLRLNKPFNEKDLARVLGLVERGLRFRNQRLHVV